MSIENIIPWIRWHCLFSLLIVFVFFLGFSLFGRIKIHRLNETDNVDIFPLLLLSFYCTWCECSCILYIYRMNIHNFVNLHQQQYAHWKKHSFRCCSGLCLNSLLEIRRKMQWSSSSHRFVCIFLFSFSFFIHTLLMFVSHTHKWRWRENRPFTSTTTEMQW